MDLSRYDIAFIAMSVGAVFFCVVGLGRLQFKAKCVCSSVLGPNTSINVFVVGDRLKENTDVCIVTEAVSRFYQSTKLYL